MDFIEFMSDNFSAEELIEWAIFYRKLYDDLGDDLFAQKADKLLTKAMNDLWGNTDTKND